MGGFTAQVFALFVIVAAGGVFFLGFHSAGRTTWLEAQRGPTLAIARFVIAASVPHVLAGLPWLFVADAVASRAVTDTALPALNPPAARQAFAGRRAGRTMPRPAAGGRAAGEAGVATTRPAAPAADTAHPGRRGSGPTDRETVPAGRFAP